MAIVMHFYVDALADQYFELFAKFSLISKSLLSPFSCYNQKKI